MICRNEKKNAAFTLVELLAVLIILAVGILFVTGVSDSVQRDYREAETNNIQLIVLKALDAYHSVHQDWPAGRGDAFSSCDLLAMLMKEPQAVKQLEFLPKSAIFTDRNGRKHLHDGFGNRIVYKRDGALPRRLPMLISKGVDTDSPADDITKGMPELEQYQADRRKE